MTTIAPTNSLPLSERANNLVVKIVNCKSEPWEDLILKEIIEIKEECAREAETFYDFDPSTQCPDWGSNGQVLHWYELGRRDAARDIRKGISENN